MDFFRGLRPWNQLLRYVDRLTLIEGSAVWAAKFTDEKMLDQLWQEYQKNRKLFDKIEDVRPPLLGFDRAMAMLTNIANLLIAQRIDMRPGMQRHLEMVPTPVFPREALELRWRDLSRRKRAEGIDAAQARWERMVQETGVRPNG